MLKDPVTNELSLEGGALVLADQGICCIDEFDKMLDADRTAIHEVMEQQTVSIAKAGIMTTLNARVSILAAANPTYGRFDFRRDLTENIELPAALLSRFDLIWVIVDKADKYSDVDLAEHITNVHKNPSNKRTFDNVLSMKDMRRFINLCKTKKPIIPEDLTDRLISIYLSIRQARRRQDNRLKDTLFTSPRSLLAIIRMATALARLRLAEVVEAPDIDEAVRLYKCSRKSIEGQVEHDPLFDLVQDSLQKLCTDKDDCERSCSMAAFFAETTELADQDKLMEVLNNLEKVEMIAMHNGRITLL